MTPSPLRTPTVSPLVAAVCSGDRARALQAILEHLAAAMVEAPAYSIAPLAGAMRAILADLDKVARPEPLQRPAGVLSTQEARARRAARREAHSASGDDLVPSS